MKFISSKKDGKISIGFLPYYLFSDLSILSAYFYGKIPDRTKTTYHMYFSDVEQPIQPFLNNIMNDSFFQFCDSNKPNCIQKPINQMNEFYFSNPKPNFHKMNLYGAAANLIPHRDCILYNFYDIHVYRIIIGLSENSNHDVATHFLNFNKTHKIQYGDYIAFDFDKTVHQVIKISNQTTERSLLKLHYIVCENCGSHYYVDFVSLFYILYYRIARYTEQLGTDPDSFVGFFFGILWEYPFYKETKYVVLGVSSSLFLYLHFRYLEGNLGKKDGFIVNINHFNHLKETCFFTFIYLFFFYLLFVFYFWISYLFFGKI